MAQQAKENVRHIQLVVPAKTYKEFKKLCVEEDTNMRAKLLDLMGRAVAEAAAPRADFFAMGAEERADMYARGINAEVDGHHAAGRFTTHGDEKGVYRLYPDGRKEYIDPVGPDKTRG